MAEVASTCNEALLIHYLMEQSKKAGDRKKTMYLMNYFLEQFRTTLFRQTMFAEFEKITHGLQEQGETLTADRLCEIYYDLNKLYFGEEICVDQEIAMEWPGFHISIHHFMFISMRPDFRQPLLCPNRFWNRELLRWNSIRNS